MAIRRNASLIVVGFAALLLLELIFSSAFGVSKKVTAKVFQSGQIPSVGSL
jgi:hypothetical protein